MTFLQSRRNDSEQNNTESNAVALADYSANSVNLQKKADLTGTAQRKPNLTGLPDSLKSGVENLSGYSMDNVRVHYNSSKPATVQALAYTQGTDIHVAPGQEQHLPHEAWHVAQQMAGRVQPTTNVNGMPVNDNTGLEHEADVMGTRAVQRKCEFVQAENTKENGGREVGNSAAQKQSGSDAAFQFVDNRAYTKSIRSLMQLIRSDENPIQRKSLAQAGKDSGLNELGNKRINNVQDGPTVGRLYGKNADDATTKPKALVNAATEAGGIGARVENEIFMSKQKVEDGIVKGFVHRKFSQFKNKAKELNTTDVVTVVNALNLNGELAAMGIPQGAIGLDWTSIYNAKQETKDFFNKKDPSNPKTVTYLEFHKDPHIDETIRHWVYYKVESNLFSHEKNLNFLDPFTVRLHSKYGNADGEINLDYQFAHDWPGYIVKIDCKGGDAFDSEMSLNHAGGGTGIPDTYSNVHDTTVDARLTGMLDLNASDTKIANEKKIDAYARIAGEGSRWIAIREHMGNLQNSSRFYIYHPDDITLDPEADRRVICVTFNTLWLSWEPAFNKKYNISNADFALKLQNSNNWAGEGKITNLHKRDMVGKDKYVGT
ncbi:MAG: DUF4157 domain-containing protein [Fibrobacteraceae bacterium]